MLTTFHRTMLGGAAAMVAIMGAVGGAEAGMKHGWRHFHKLHYFRVYDDCGYYKWKFFRTGDYYWKVKYKRCMGWW